MKKNNFITGVIALFGFFLFFSCSKNNNQSIYFNNIENNEELQSALLFSYNNDSISMVNYNILKGFYKEQKNNFQYENFENLLTKLDDLTTNDRKMLYFSKNYKANQYFEAFKELSTEQLAVKLHLVKSGNNIYSLSASKFKEEDLFPILFSFYKKGNYIIHDDDVGNYLILSSQATIK
ncbi:hypothetical protein [Chryseobacterium gregarium]|uniref:hypothetical protein n=1 Tax=Chryseobacterium gregarium TaxID=456299 RepID=UPI0004855960|nr:hypothetical protein [Chryseobacterium gregarium]